MSDDDCKRCASEIAAMEEEEEEEESSSTGPTIISKKRKITTHFQLRASHIITVSPETSVNSAGTVVSGMPSSDLSPLSSCSSACYVAETGEAVKTALLDLELQTKGFETVDSTNRNFKSFSLLSEFSGDSEESSMFPPEKRSTAAARERRKMKKTPPMAEIEEFFAAAEKHEEKRFAEKYNFDIVRDTPLEGRYQWVRLH